MSREMTFAQAAEAHLDDVYGYLAWFTGDRTAADDLAGETFERALRLWHRFDPRRGSARTWRQGSSQAMPGPLRSSAGAAARRLAAAPERFEERFTEGLSPDLQAALTVLTAGEREVVARVVLDLDAQTAASISASPRPTARRA
jgi:DNA-directed RNA polymerase specialized sigma24 family protein